LRSAWGSGATRENHDAGYDGLTLHDLRRSGARNLRRAGVSEDVAVKITGHRTRAIFTRYNIVDADDLHDAMDSVQMDSVQKLITNSLQKPAKGTRRSKGQMSLKPA
jgi:integrase